MDQELETTSFITLPQLAYVFGEGGFAKEVKWLITDTPSWNFVGFIGEKDEDAFEEELKDDYKLAVIGIGDPSIIHKIAARFVHKTTLSWPNIIHPTALGDWNNIDMGFGNIICARNIFTTDIKIGVQNIFNLNSTYGHDVVIGNHCVINPGCNISGGVTLEGHNSIGTGVKILPNITIGWQATIGAGAVVTKDVPQYEIWVGVPAKKLGS